MGMTAQQAQQGYGQIGGILPTLTGLGKIDNISYDQTDAENEVFGGLASATAEAAVALASMKLTASLAVRLALVRRRSASSPRVTATTSPNRPPTDRPAPWCVFVR
jgi:hypothetical protein